MKCHRLGIDTIHEPEPDSKPEVGRGRDREGEREACKLQEAGVGDWDGLHLPDFDVWGRDIGVLTSRFVGAGRRVGVRTGTGSP